METAGVGPCPKLDVRALAPEDGMAWRSSWGSAPTTGSRGHRWLRQSHARNSWPAGDAGQPCQQSKAAHTQLHSALLLQVLGWTHAATEGAACTAMGLHHSPSMHLHRAKGSIGKQTTPAQTTSPTLPTNTRVHTSHSTHHTTLGGTTRMCKSSCAGRNPELTRCLFGVVCTVLCMVSSSEGQSRWLAALLS